MTNDRLAGLLERLDARSVETLERLARIEVEVVTISRAQGEADQQRAALLARIDRLEADRDRRDGEIRHARRVGVGGAVAGATGLVGAAAQAAWDWLSGLGG